MTLGRKPLTLVEIDLPYCSRVYGTSPCTARLGPNLLLRSEEFDNATWSKATVNGTVTADAAVGPVPGSVSDSYVENTANAGRAITQSVTVTSGTAYTLSCFAMMIPGVTRFLGLVLPTARFGVNVIASYTLSGAGTVNISVSGTNTSAGIVAIGGGWYRCWLKSDATSTGAGAVQVRVSNSSTNGAASYIGNGTAGLYLWGAQVNAGALGGYARTTSAAITGAPTGAAKCFKARVTCQDPTNYAAISKTITFAPNQAGIPAIPGIYPALQGVSAVPGELNLSGIDPRSTALGKRARVTVRLQDFADNDTYLDEYQAERVTGIASATGAAYNPLNRGRFLARLIARFPYYLGIPLRVRRGYVGDAPASMPTEHYVISEVSGPNAAGVFEIVAKDVLDLAENEKAVYPKASRGKLLAAITAEDTAATLTPAGIGNIDYPASGLVRIGREIMAFTRTGDALTLTRGQEGTTAAAQNALDVVQICGVLDGLTINQAAETILKYETTAFDAFIDTAGWQTENDTWLSGTTIGRVIISKPTGKKTLIGELCQLGVMIWWDPVAQEVRYKVNSPLLPDETYFDVTDAANIIKGTPDVDRGEDQRISALWFYHGVRDWTDDSLASRNFNKLAIAAVDDNLYGQEAYKEIYTRWFGRTGDDTSASIIGERLLARYINPPKVVSGALDVKDRADVSLGSQVLIESYVLQDVDGATLAVPMQVNYVEYSDGRVKFRAEEYRVEGAFGFWMDDATAPADYDIATPAQRATGAFWGDATAPASTDSIWF